MLDLLKRILDSITDYAFIIDTDYKILYSNFNDLKRQKKNCYEAIFNQNKVCSFCSFFTPSENPASPEKDQTLHLVNHPLFHLSHQSLTLTQKNIDTPDKTYFIEIISKNNNGEEISSSDHLTTLGAHVQTIGHELSNPITGLNLTHQKILDICGKKTEIKISELKPFLDLIGSDIKRASEIVSEIRSYSQHVSPNRVVDLKNTIANAIDYVKRIHPGSKVETVLNWDIPEKIQFHGVSGKLEQCFINILKNSYDMFEIRGKIKNPEIIINSELLDGKNVTIDIIDNAGGISNDALRNAFKPYFTTKERYRGQGLGLYITGQILKEHGGSISMKSSGNNTIVTISLKVPE